jgi:hypothetical protein
MLSCNHGGMTTRFAQERGRPAAGEYHSSSGWHAGMLLCRRANTAARQHSRHGTGGGRQCEGAIPATGVRACSHAVVRARRQTSTVGAGEGTAVRGPIPATAGTQACSYALVRTRGATAHSALGADSGRGSLWLRRGEGEGALCAGPEARLSALVRLKDARFGSKTDIFRRDSGKGSANIWSGPTRNATRPPTRDNRIYSAHYI